MNDQGYNLMIQECSALFKEGMAITNTKTLVNIAYRSGLKPGVDYHNFKMLYDLCEYAMNLHLKRLLAKYDRSDSNQIKSIILSQSSLLPNETERSVDQSIYQQFSTPILTAYQMASIAEITHDDIILEPSAGTGTLAAMSELFGPKKIFTNELHPFRHQLLCYNDDQASFNEDATQLHNMDKFRKLKITKCIMNPPFTRHINTKTKIALLAGAKHMLSAYKLLESSGLLIVLINSTFNEKSASRKFFFSQAKAASIELDYMLDQSTFLKKGTGTSTRILKIRKSPNGGSKTSEKIPSLRQAMELIK